MIPFYFKNVLQFLTDNTLNKTSPTPYIKIFKILTVYKNFE